MTDISPRAALSDAISYWEPRRVIFNLALVAVACAVFLANLPRSRAELTFGVLACLFLLAVGVNIAYCAAHVVDVVVQLSPLRSKWRQFRWVLLVIETLVGGACVNSMAQALWAHAT